SRSAHLEERVLVEIGNWLAVPFRELGLRVEQINLARAAIHEQKDARFSPGRVVGIPWSQRRLCSCRRASRLGEEPILSEQVCQSRADEAASGLPEELAPRAAARC